MFCKIGAVAGDGGHGDCEKLSETTEIGDPSSFLNFSSTSLSPFPPPLRGRGREGGGVIGTACETADVIGTARKNPSPQPSPARGEGADRLRNAHLIQLQRADMRSPSRGAFRPRLAGNFPCPPIRGRRESRVRAAPAVSCAKCTRKNAHEHTGQRRHSDFPRAVV